MLLAVVLVLVTGCGGDDDIDLELVYNPLLGGETTAFSSSGNAFELSARNLPNEIRRIFEIGDSFFTQNWVTAPASTEARDGLGATFNAISCSSCHNHDGRAKPPDHDGDPERGLLLRLSIPSENGPVDDPVYGGQLQDRAIIGVPAEGRITIVYEEISGQYPDGTPYSLRRPIYGIADLAFGPLHPDIQISPRIAPAVIGMGLLEAISETRILELADPDDADGDGISGRPNYVWDIRRNGPRLGPLRLEGERPHRRAAGRRRLPGRRRHHLGPIPRGELPTGPGCVRPGPNRRHAGDSHGPPPESDDLRANTCRPRHA